MGDLCIDYEEVTVRDHVHESATPLGGVYAGKYIKAAEDVEVTECFKLCCQCEVCNVMFYHSETCFLIVCNVSYPHQDACKPKQRQGDKFKDTFMIDVRTIGDYVVFIKGRLISSNPV